MLSNTTPPTWAHSLTSCGASGLWLGVMALIVPSCMSYTLEDEPRPLSPEPLARARPNDWGYSSVLSSCTASASDDVCERCEKTACCNEIEACDRGCQDQYQAYQQCLYPAPGLPWSGLGSKACLQRLPVSPSTLQVVALIDCAASKCSTQETCGIEPRATFSAPPTASPTASPSASPPGNFSAAEFLENYCVGCHFDGFLGPTGKPTSAFSHDREWWAPRWNTNWLVAMDYDLAV